MSKFFEYACLAALAYAYQPITVSENGIDKTVYITGCSPSSDGRGMRCSGPSGGKLSETNYLDPEGWYRPNVLGGSVSFNVDLSGQQCGCNAAFYQVRMPGKDQNGNYVTGGQGDYYCDANQVGGTFCPEFDIMEADMYSY